MIRRGITITISLLIIGIAIVISMKYLQSRQIDEYFKKGPSNQEVLQVITRDKPALLYNNRPVIEIASIKRFENKWYVITIKSPKDKDVKVPVKIVLQDISSTPSARNLKTIIGPDTHFTEYQQLKYSLPDSVTKELQS